jgi:hypothetical protein
VTLSDILFPVARDHSRLTREELAEFKRLLEALAANGVETAYNAALKECRIDEGGKLPAFATLQRLFAIWRVLTRKREAKMPDDVRA